LTLLLRRARTAVGEGDEARVFGLVGNLGDALRHCREALATAFARPRPDGLADGYQLSEWGAQWSGAQNAQFHFGHVFEKKRTLK
jgi:hypothetical protein